LLADVFGRAEQGFQRSGPGRDHGEFDFLVLGNGQRRVNRAGGGDRTSGAGSDELTTFHRCLLMLVIKGMPAWHYWPVAECACHDARRGGQGLLRLQATSSCRCRGGPAVERMGRLHCKACRGMHPAQNIRASRPAAMYVPSSSQSSAKLSCHSPRQVSGSCTACQRSPEAMAATARLVPERKSSA